MPKTTETRRTEYVQVHDDAGRPVLGVVRAWCGNRVRVQVSATERLWRLQRDVLSVHRSAPLPWEPETPDAR